MYGIEFKSRHSYKDFKITIKSRNLGFPEPDLILERLAFMNGSYDFSEINGEITYGDRTLTYVFNVISWTKKSLHDLKTTISNWLRTGTKSILKDDIDVGWHYIAQVSKLDFPEENFRGELTVEFTAQPFKIRNEAEGKLLWDTFSFRNDISQKTSFDIYQLEVIYLCNNGAKTLVPTINASENCKIKLNGVIYELEKGVTKDYHLKLTEGINVLTVTSDYNLKIEFTFYREVL